MPSTSSFYDIINDVYDSATSSLTVTPLAHTHQSAGQGGQLDHGLALTGLTDDDHTQYLKEADLTTRGDIYYRNATVTTRLPLGTNGQYLSSDGTDIYWAAGTPLTSNLIVMWHGTIANIPSGYVICDGNNSTPNLLAKFVQGVATAATDPGTTGGSQTAHTHTIANSEQTDAGAGAGKWGRSATTTATGGTTDGRPPFYDVAFLMKT